MTTTEKFSLASRLSDELPDGVKIEPAGGWKLNAAGLQWALDVSDNPSEEDLRSAARDILDAYGERIKKWISFSPTGSEGGSWFAERS